MHDLESAGVIEPKDRVFAPKWKHYRIAPTPTTESELNKPILNRSTAVRNGIIMAIIAFAFIGYLYFATNNSVYVPISITDPPQVPYGTQALNINYSSLSVHVVSGSGSSQWVQVNSSGTLNLMSLINESEVIGSVKIPGGSRIVWVKFNISSASITINNNTYPVNLVSNNIGASVQANSTLNSSSGVLLDFYPAVIEQNSSTFVLLPHVKAAVVPSPQGLHGPSVGNFVNVHARYQLGQGAFGFVTQIGNLSITNAQVSGSGNSTTLDISVYNNGNSSVTICGALMTAEQNYSELNQSGNWSENGYFIGGGSRAKVWAVHQGNGSVIINSTEIDRYSHYLRNGTTAAFT